MRSDEVKRSRTRDKGEQRGLTLVEVMIAVVIMGLLMTAALAWASSTIGAQATARRANVNTKSISFVKAAMIRDIASSQFAASGTSSTSPFAARGAGDLTNCEVGIGTGGATGTVVLATVSTNNHRVVYVLSDPVGGSTGTPGKVLWRRDCANNGTTLGMPSSDPTLNDSVLRSEVRQPASNQTTAQQGTDGAQKLAEGVLSVTTNCPLEGSSDEDPKCPTVKVNLTFADSSDASTADTKRPAVVFQAARRSDTYCPPGCPPIARFTYSPNPPSKNAPVGFDASTSVDPRGSALTYQWNFDTPHQVADGGPTDVTCLPSTPPAGTGMLPSFTYTVASTPACPDFLVTLTVTTDDGRVGSTTQRLVVPPKKPLALITNTPYKGVRAKTINFTGQAQAFEGPLNIASSYWSWGDGTATVATGCAADLNLCTTAVPHAYTTTGTFLVKLVVTDSTGLSSTFTTTVTVESEVYYVASAGVDDGTCGPVGKPCRTINQGLTRASATGRTDIYVAASGGAYPSFTAAAGINVTGGFNSTSWLPNSGTTTVAGALRSGTTWVGIDAAGISAGSPTVLSNLTVQPSDAVPGNVPVVGISVSSSPGLSLSGVTVNGGRGAHATGVLVNATTGFTISGSTITSGTPTGVGGSAYGIRALGSTVVLNTTSVHSLPGANGSPGTSGSTPGGIGCDADNGVGWPSWDPPTNYGAAGCGGGGNGGEGGRGSTFSGDDGASAAVLLGWTLGYSFASLGDERWVIPLFGALIAITVSALVGIVMGLALVGFSRKHIPFGPALIAGTLITIALAEPIRNWVTGA